MCERTEPCTTSSEITLGSTSIVTDAAGNAVSQTKYRAASLWDKAWGEVRYSSGTSPTNYTYTGQKSHVDSFGLLFYNARFYDPALSRFISPDTIIPENQGVQALDRLSYVNNNPLRYTDPTGHRNCEEDGYNCPGDDYKSSNKGGGRGILGIILPEPTGNNVELNILAGISIKAEGLDGNPTTVGLLYYSVGFVTDKEGGLQFYYSKMDTTYQPGSSSHMGGYTSGPAESDNPTSAFGLGITVNRGVIVGRGFTTEKFMGKGYSTNFPTGTPLSGGYVTPYDRSLDYEAYELSVGGGFSMGSVATDTYKINKNPFDIPDQLIPVCQMMGQCGAYVLSWTH